MPEFKLKPLLSNHSWNWNDFRLEVQNQDIAKISSLSKFDIFLLLLVAFSLFVFHGLCYYEIRVM